MFSFVFKIPKEKINWNIIINGHTIECSQKTASSISKVISQHIKKDKSKTSYSITIPEFENSFVCSESDYQYFDNIFNLVPLQISNINSGVLKIFAEKFEIEELSSLIKIFESYYDIISNDQSIQIQKDITNELADIDENSFESLLQHFSEIEKSENNILTLDFIYLLFFSSCFSKPTKIELFLTFLKKYEENTNGGQFEYFKKKLLEEFKLAYEIDRNYVDNSIEKTLYSNYPLKSAYFILNYLCNIKEINESDMTKYRKRFQNCYSFNSQSNRKGEFSQEEIEEYKKSGYNPTQLYQAIKNDDLDLFTHLMTQKSDTNDFNNKISLLSYERNPDILFQKKNFSDEIRNLELAAVYGSEKIFNYILLNIKDVEIEPITVRMAFIGGNNSIIHKCVEKIEMDDNLLEMCIILTIKYKHQELFEWLYEEHEVVKNKKVYDHLIQNAIKFNNIDVVIFLLSSGFDYTSLFMLSLLFDQFNLARLAIKLPYSRDIPKTQKKSLQPFTYKYDDILFYFFDLNYHFLLLFIKIKLNLLK